MSSPLAGLEPRALWQHFDALRQIPHPSRAEAALIAHIRAWAEERGFEAAADAVGNLLVRVPASPGREGAATVMLQGHVDMVCQQAEGRGFDFENDPIEVEVKDGWVWAKGTTLGADNGIGVAAGMAAADDPSVSHGPLELLFTVDEETGMGGANGLDFPDAKARLLLNLDTEEIGALYVGCAGGGKDELTLDLARMEPHQAPGGNATLQLSVAGLKGGHSGLEIGAHRANAVKLLARVLWGLRGEVAYALDGLRGGSAHNAIPNEASARVVLGGADLERARGVIDELCAETAREFAAHEPDMRWAVETADEPEDVLATRSRDNLLRLLVALPHGVEEMSREMPGLVETSSTVAIVTAEGERASVLISSRSSVPEALVAQRMRVAAVGELAGADVNAEPSYPAWRPNVDSPLLAVCRDVWKNRTGEEPIVTAIHAGLECGVIGEKMPGMDMISFGPTILGAHTVEERVEIGTVATFWDFLVALLARL